MVQNLYQKLVLLLNKGNTNLQSPVREMLLKVALKHPKEDQSFLNVLSLCEIT